MDAAEEELCGPSTRQRAQAIRHPGPGNHASPTGAPNGERQWKASTRASRSFSRFLSQQSSTSTGQSCISCIEGNKLWSVEDCVNILLLASPNALDGTEFAKRQERSDETQTEREPHLDDDLEKLENTNSASSSMKECRASPPSETRDPSGQAYILRWSHQALSKRRRGARQLNVFSERAAGVSVLHLLVQRAGDLWEAPFLLRTYIARPNTRRASTQSFPGQ
eukprot:scaffold620_cov282-Pinguiococcus_pyrenoidosus.AAC.15